MRVVSFRDRLRPELADLRAYRVPPADVPVKLDANENPHALSESARAELARELAKVDLNRYPEPRATRLREIWADRLGLSPDQLIVGNGVDEMIAFVLTAFTRPPPGRDQAAVMYPWPSFVMFRIGAQVHGLRAVEVPLDASW